MNNPDDEGFKFHVVDEQGYIELMTDDKGRAERFAEKFSGVRTFTVREMCDKCGREKGCSGDCEDMNCDHCYCHRDGRDG